MGEEDIIGQETDQSVLVDKPIYLGKRKVRFASVQEEFVGVIFEDESQILLHVELYDILKSEIPVEEELSDLVYITLAKMFLNQCIKYDLLGSQVDHIAQNMTNLSINMYSAATNKLWKGKTNMQVSLQEIKEVLDKE